MSFKTCMDEKIRKMECWDISFVKLSTAAFILMVAKLWKPILGLEWYWYLIIAVLAAIKPCYNMFKKESL